MVCIWLFVELSHLYWLMFVGIYRNWMSRSLASALTSTQQKKINLFDCNKNAFVFFYVLRADYIFWLRSQLSTMAEKKMWTDVTLLAAIDVFWVFGLLFLGGEWAASEGGETHRSQQRHGEHDKSVSLFFFIPFHSIPFPTFKNRVRVSAIHKNTWKREQSNPSLCTNLTYCPCGIKP